MKYIKHNCLNCTAELRYNSDKKIFECNYCKSRFKIDNGNMVEIKTNKMYTYHCSKCNSDILINEKENINFCIYCGNRNILKNKYFEDLDSKYLIPFKYSKKQVINIYKSNAKKNKYLPEIFLNKKIYNSIKTLYVPVLLCNFNVNGNVQFDSEKITNWKSGSYKYKKTDSYIVERDISLELSDVPIYSSNFFNEETMKYIMPYDFKNIRQIESKDLDKYMIEEFNMDKEQVNLKSKDKAFKLVINILKDNLKEYNVNNLKDNSLKLKLTNLSLVYVPVYLLNIKYINNNYTFIMNGQNGKVEFEFPTSRKKIVLTLLFIFIIIFIILLGLSYFKVIL